MGTHKLAAWRTAWEASREGVQPMRGLSGFGSPEKEASSTSTYSRCCVRGMFPTSMAAAHRTSLSGFAAVPLPLPFSLAFDLTQLAPRLPPFVDVYSVQEPYSLETCVSWAAQTPAARCEVIGDDATLVPRLKLGWCKVVALGGSVSTAMLLTSCCSCASDADSSALPHARTATHRPQRQWQWQHLAARPHVGTSSAARCFLPWTAQASTTGARRSINQPHGYKDMSAPPWTAMSC